MLEPRFNLYYSEVIGNPIRKGAETPKTQEYPVLLNVTAEETTDFIARFDWSRSWWRTEPTEPCNCWDDNNRGVNATACSIHPPERMD